jgi:hypothetical protein
MIVSNSCCAPGIVLFLEMAKSPVKPVVLVSRINQDSLVIITDSLLELALPDAADGPEIIHLIIVRVQVNGLPHIFLGPHEIIQIVLCHSTKIPRLIKIRLGINGQVKVLNRKHIVFIIQSTPAG